MRADPPGRQHCRRRRRIVLRGLGRRPVACPPLALWLQRYRGSSEGEDPDTWQILGADGVWLGNLMLPDRFELLGVDADEVLGVWRDELDIEHPQVLRLDRDR